MTIDARSPITKLSTAVTEWEKIEIDGQVGLIWTDSWYISKLMGNLHFYGVKIMQADSSNSIEWRHTSKIDRFHPFSIECSIEYKAAY